MQTVHEGEGFEECPGDAAPVLLKDELQLVINDVDFCGTNLQDISLSLSSRRW
jgi:hypothetical protein